MDLFSGPIDGRIDSFEPGHTKDELVIPYRCDVEGVFVFNAGDGVLEGGFAGCMTQSSAIGDSDFDRGTRTGFKVEQAHNGFIDKVE